MGEYADVSSKKFCRMLKRLEHKHGDKIKICPAGRHNLKAEHFVSGDSYPLPTSHRVMNKHIVKDFKEWLVKRNVCTETEFDAYL